MEESVKGSRNCICEDLVGIVAFPACEHGQQWCKMSAIISDFISMGQ